jgi:hypothetical protein
MKISSSRARVSAIAAAASLMAASAMAGVGVTPTTDPSALGAALGGSGVTINSVTVTNGAASQFGTYTGFNGSVVTLGNGIVLSTGNAADTAKVGNDIDTDTGASGTPEFDAYGTGHVTNFSDSNDVAALKVSFTLASASAVSFSFVFGSIEFPEYVNEFTDAFLVFLDGTGVANQIVFDASNNPVQVGTSFASSLVTGDTSTAFTDPHGLVGVLTTTSGSLSAGDHTLWFEVGDVNDHALDSAAFITNLHAATGTDGGPTTVPSIPEPSTYAMMALGLAGLAAVKRRRRMPS